MNSKNFYKLFPKPVIILFIILFGSKAGGQCPPKPTNPVVINEVSGDSGQSDASNDGIVELAGVPGTVIGGMVVTNGDWAVIIPAGTVIPADGVYLIACSQQTVSAAGGVAGEGIANSCVPGTNGLSCSQCDYPGLVPDFDVCDPTNAIYYDPTASGFTIDNVGISDGDQVVLFNHDGTIADAVKWEHPLQQALAMLLMEDLQGMQTMLLPAQ